jgi:hypothetical protein
VAFREIHRVTRRGGRAVVGTPGCLTRSAGFAEVRDILHGVIPDLDLDIELPLTEADDLQREMSAAGFAAVAVVRVTRSFAYPSVAAVWAAASRAAAPIVVAREAMGGERWARASEEIVRGLIGRFGTGPQEIEVTANLARAEK